MSIGGWIIVAALAALVLVSLGLLVAEVVCAWKEWREERRVARLVRDVIDKMRRGGL